MAFTRVAACLLAEPPKAARGLEGFDGFVASTAAPIATGWSDQLSGRDLHPLKIRAFPRRTATHAPSWPTGRRRSTRPAAAWPNPASRGTQHRPLPRRDDRARKKGGSGRGSSRPGV
jgi:hypothetical protein